MILFAVSVAPTHTHTLPPGPQPLPIPMLSSPDVDDLVDLRLEVEEPFDDLRGVTTPVHAIGHMNEGVRFGLWKLYRDDDTPYGEGAFVDGERHGPWTFFDQESRYLTRRITCTYAHGKLQGAWREVIYQDEGGTLPVLEANYLDGVLHGQQVRRDHDGHTLLTLDYAHGKIISPRHVEELKFGERVEGPYRDGKRDGIWTWYDNDDAVHVRLEYDAGVIRDQSVTAYEEGRVAHTGHYVGGERDGDWTYHDRKGRIEEVRRYRAGVLLCIQPHHEGEPVGACEPPRGTRQDPLTESGPTWDGLREGIWLTRCSHGKLVKTQTYVRGERHGASRGWDEEGHETFSGSYEHDARSGEWRRWHADGVLASRGRYEAGFRVGVWEEWEAWGHRWHTSKTYVRGILHGLYSKSYEGNVEESGHYADGQRHGMWLEPDFFDSRRTGRYRMGVPVGTWHTVYEDGKARETIHYIRGRRHGPYVRWRHNGSRAEVGTYEGGERHGLWETFYRDESKRTETHYQLGSRRAHTAWYDDAQLAERHITEEDGSSTHEKWWHNGQLIMHEHHDPRGELISAKYFSLEGEPRDTPYYGPRRSCYSSRVEEFE